MVLHVATCSNRCFDDVLWRWEVGLARAETDAALRELRESELAADGVTEAEKNDDMMEAP